MKLILVRHGETTGNSEIRYWGATDVPLSEHGLAQARKLAGRFSGQEFDAVYCSEMKRAVSTLEEILRGRSISHTKCAELKELNFGLLEGYTAGEIRSAYPDFYAQWVQWDANMAFPGGESVEDFRARIGLFEKKLAAEKDSKTVLVVAHAGTLRMLMCNLLGLPLPYWRKLKLDLASVSTLELTPPGWLLTGMNDTAHLR